MSTAKVIKFPVPLCMTAPVAQATRSKANASATLEDQLTALIDETGLILGNLIKEEQEFVLKVLELVSNQVRQKGYNDWKYNLRL